MKKISLLLLTLCLILMASCGKKYSLGAQIVIAYEEAIEQTENVKNSTELFEVRNTLKEKEHTIRAKATRETAPTSEEEKVIARYAEDYDVTFYRVQLGLEE